MIDKYYFIIEFGLYNLLVLISLNYLNKTSKIIFPTTFIWLSSFFICLLGCITADYYGYIEIIDRLSELFIYSEIEDIYSILAYVIEYNSFYFRGILTIIIFVGLYYLFKYSRIDNKYELAVFVVIGLLTISNVLRSSLSEVIILIGAFPFFKKKNVVNFCLLVIMIIIGFFFHKSAFMLILLVSLACLPLSKNLIKVTILCYPIIVFMGIICVNLIFKHYFDSSSYQENSTFGSKMIMLTSFIYNVLSILIWILVLKINSNLLKSKDTFLKSIYKYLFWGLAIYGVILMSGVSRYVYERLIVYCLIPLIILIAISYKQNKQRSLFLGLFCGLWVYNNILIYFNYLTKQSELAQNTISISLNSLF